MGLITDIRLRRILDSRGNPTVEADVFTENGGFGRAAAPSGASTGAHEAVERPVGEAIAAARETLVPRLVDSVYAGDQRAVDAQIAAADGTDNFSELGANSAVAVSMAAAKAGADLLGVPLFHHLGGTFRGETMPTPLGNVIGGGEHAQGGPSIQEFLAAPVGAPNVADAVFANAAVHQWVGEELANRGYDVAKGDEGAWAPPIDDDLALSIMAEATDAVEDDVGFEIAIGMDVAATECYSNKKYHFGEATRSPEEQIAHVADLTRRHDLVYIEDPLQEDDFEGFGKLTQAVDDVLICGDDLFVTNTERLQRGIDIGAANSILIKPNQIGTLTAAVDAIELAEDAGYQAVISHRSGETEDTTIAHLAVATGAPFIKTGTVGGERTAKLNELIRIETDAL